MKKFLPESNEFIEKAQPLRTAKLRRAGFPQPLNVALSPSGELVPIHREGWWRIYTKPLFVTFGCSAKSIL